MKQHWRWCHNISSFNNIWCWSNVTRFFLSQYLPLFLCSNKLNRHYWNDNEQINTNSSLSSLSSPIEKWIRKEDRTDRTERHHQYHQEYLILKIPTDVYMLRDQLYQFYWYSTSFRLKNPVYRSEASVYENIPVFKTCTSFCTSFWANGKNHI